VTAPHLTQETCLCSLDRSAGYGNSITGLMYFVRGRNVLFHVKHFADLNCDLVTGAAYNGHTFCSARYSHGSGSAMEEN